MRQTHFACAYVGGGLDGLGSHGLLLGCWARLAGFDRLVERVAVSEK